MIQMLHKRKSYALAILTAILLWGGTAIGQTNTWDGSTSNDWNTATNWSLNLVPIAAHDVVININAAITFSGNGVAGSLTISGNRVVSLTAAGGGRTLTLSKTTGPALDVQSGSTLSIAGTTGGGTRDMTLTFAAPAGKVATIAGTFDNTGIGDGTDYNTSNAITTVSGTFIDRDALTGDNATRFIVTGTGTYEYAQNGGNLPTATWNTGSTVNISGVTNALPGNAGQILSNLTFSSALTSDITWTTIPTINGNLIMSNTGTRILTVTSSPTGRILTVGGDFTHTSGNFRGNSSSGGATINVGGNFNQSGGTFSLKEGTGNAAMNITGNFTKTGGTFNQRTTTTTGTSVVTVGGNFSNSVGTYNMSSVAAIGVLNVTGDFSVTSAANTFTESAGGSGTVNFTGSGTHTYTANATAISTTINFNVATGNTLQMATPTTAVTGTGTFTLASGATLGITSADGITTLGTPSGNILTTGGRSYDAGANYLYNGTGAQNTGTGFQTNLLGDLIINNPGNIVTLSSAKTIASGGLVNLQAGTFASGTNLTMATNSSFLKSAGSLTGTFAGGDYDVEYAGTPGTTGPELQGGQGGGTRLRNLTINLTTGQSVNLTAETSMKGELTLNTGLLALGANILEMTATATCTNGGNPTSYVSGRMRKIGAADFVFPLGLATYKPVGFSGSSTDFTADLTGTATITALAFNLNPLKAVAPKVFTGSLVSLTNCFLWQIERDDAGTNDVFVWTSTGPAGGAFSTENLTSCFGPTTPPTTVVPADLRVARHNGSVWLDLGQGAQVQRSNAWFISSSVASTTFSPFTVGSAQDVLPVSLASFTASKQGASVDLKWTTASEQNNAYFTVERSADGVSFSAIGKVNGAGNSSSTLNYSYTDNNPLAGKNFYRLRQVDFDGQFDISAIVSVNLSVTSKVSLYPNPVSNTALLQYPKAVKGAGYRLVAMDGRVMKSGILQENSTQMNLNLSGMQSGTYVLIINNNGEQYQQRIQKQ